MALSAESSDDIGRFFACIKSINELDKLEVRSIVNGGLLGTPTNRENYFLLNYNRAVLSVELLLTLTDYKHFQTVAMISRSVFELAVEMWMMQRDKDYARQQGPVNRQFRVPLLDGVQAGGDLVRDELNRFGSEVLQRRLKFPPTPE